MKTLILNPQLLNLKFEPSLLKFPSPSANWELPTAIICLVGIITACLMLSKLGLVYNSVCGY